MFSPLYKTPLQGIPEYCRKLLRIFGNCSCVTLPRHGPCQFFDRSLVSPSTCSYDLSSKGGEGTEITGSGFKQVTFGQILDSVIAGETGICPNFRRIQVFLASLFLRNRRLLDDCQIDITGAKVLIY